MGDLAVATSALLGAARNLRGLHDRLLASHTGIRRIDAAASGLPGPTPGGALDEYVRGWAARRVADRFAASRPG